MANKSGYQASWDKLKKEGKMLAILNVPESTPLATRKALFHRYRKALSTRKDKDHGYYLNNPTAKIRVDEKNYDTMTFKISLVFSAETITLLDLRDM